MYIIESGSAQVELENPILLLERRLFWQDGLSTINMNSNYNNFRGSQTSATQRRRLRRGI